MLAGVFLRSMRFLFAGLALAAVPIALAQKQKEPTVLVVSDAPTEMPEAYLPTPEQPVYYVLLGGRERHLGDIMARDPMPDFATVRAEVVKVLTSQGFIETGVGGPAPSIAIAVNWGSANLTYMEYEETSEEGLFQEGEEDFEQPPDTATVTVGFNQRDIARLLGMYKGKRRMFSYVEADEINAAANEDRFYLFIAALDAAALAKKKKKLIWRSRISIPARRTTLPESMGVMLTSAAPFFGRDVDRPLVVDDKVRRQRAEVIIGPTTVVEEEDGGR